MQVFDSETHLGVFVIACLATIQLLSQEYSVNSKLKCSHSIHPYVPQASVSVVCLCVCVCVCVQALHTSIRAPDVSLRERECVCVRAQSFHTSIRAPGVCQCCLSVSVSVCLCVCVQALHTPIRAPDVSQREREGVCVCVCSHSMQPYAPQASDSVACVRAQSLASEEWIGQALRTHSTTHTPPACMHVRAPKVA
jgi:hypothetical protein